MIRKHELFLALLAAGFVAALFSSGGTKNLDRVWDPRESRSDALGVGSLGGKTANFPSTRETLGSWAGAACPPQVKTAVYRPGMARRPS